MQEEDLAKHYKDQGNKEFKAGNFTLAIEFYTKAIEKQKDKTFYTNRAICFFNLNKFRKCISDCEEALKLDSCFAKAFFRKTDALISLGILKEALDTVTKANEVKPNDDDIKRKVTDVKVLISYKDDYTAAFEKRDFETCLRKLDCLLEKCTHDRELIVKKIEITAYLGKIDEALVMVKKYTPDYSSFSDFIWVQGLVYLYRGNT